MVKLFDFAGIFYGYKWKKCNNNVFVKILA